MALDSAPQGVRNSALAQQAIDEGGEYVFDRAKEYHVPHLAFRNTRVGGMINGWWTGTPLFVSLPRGWTPAAAWRSDGFELKDSQLWCVRNEWSNGPRGELPGNRWGSVRKMWFGFAMTKLDGTDWHNVGIVGMAGVHGSVGPGDPQPYNLQCYNGMLVLATRWTDGVVRRFTVPIAPGTVTLAAELEVDFANKTSACNLGTVTAVDGWPPAGARLTENNVYGCGIGRVSLAAGSWGHAYGEAWPNMVIHRMHLVWNDRRDIPLVLWVHNERPPTYDDKPEHVLPLVQASPGAWAQVVHRDQIHPYQWGGGIELDRLEINGRGDCALVIHHGMFDGISAYRCLLYGGQSQIATANTGVAYPMKFRDCRFAHANISNVFLGRSWQTEFTGCGFKYGRETALHTLGCGVHMSDCTNAPPGYEQRAVVLQQGGAGYYVKLQDDIEWIPASHYHLVEAIGESHDMPWFGTKVELKDCSYDARYDAVRLPKQLVKAYDAPAPAAPYKPYRGQFEVVVDGRTVLAHRLLEEWVD